MYWDINRSAASVLSNLRKDYPGVVCQREGDSILVFLFDNEKDHNGFKYFKIIFLTNFHSLLIGEKRYDSSFSRIIKCKDEGQAKIVAEAMLREEIYSQEYLTKIDGITSATKEEVKRAQDSDYRLRALAKELSASIIVKEGKSVGLILNPKAGAPFEIPLGPEIFQYCSSTQG